MTTISNTITIPVAMMTASTIGNCNVISYDKSLSQIKLLNTMLQISNLLSHTSTENLAWTILEKVHV